MGLDRVDTGDMLGLVLVVFPRAHGMTPLVWAPTQNPKLKDIEAQAPVPTLPTVRSRLARPKRRP
jgi:hypothetical protein